MPEQDWRTALSFSDRFAAINTIQDTYDRCGRRPGGGAQSLEAQAYRDATSRPQYDALISAVVVETQDLDTGPCPHDDILEDHVSATDVQTEKAGGITIGNYTHALRHKDGVTSSVWRAYDPVAASSSLKRGVVALKIVQLAAVVAPHDIQREIRLLDLVTSDRIITLLDRFRQTDGTFVLVFPFIPLDLADVLDNGPLPRLRALAVIKDLMSALVYIHELGIIHRDIKPSNILLHGSGGPAVLADFGIAWKEYDPACEAAEAKILDVGTTSYRAPELLFGHQRYDSSLDMWASGCVVAQILALGRRPLFDSGDLGSDLTLIKSIFETLGTPDASSWPDVSSYPDWGKMLFHEFHAKDWSEVLPNAEPQGLELVAGLIQYQSSDRWTASRAVKSAYLA